MTAGNSNDDPGAHHHLELLWAQHKTRHSGILLHQGETILEINQGLQDITGFSSEELNGQSILNIISPSCHQEVISYINSSSRKPFQAIGKTKDDREFTLIIETATITYNQQRASITEIKDLSRLSAEEEHELFSRTWYKALFEQATDALYVHDYNGRILEVNQQACNSLGYSREELLQMSITDFEINSNLESAKKEWDTIEPGKPYKLKGMHRRKNGSLMPVEVNFGCSMWKGHKIYVALTHDITLSHEAEERLRQSEEKFRSIVEGFPEPLFIQYQDSFVYLNPAAVELFGYSNPGELLGSPVRDFIYPDYRHDFDRISSLAQQDKGEGKYKLSGHRILARGKPETWVNTSGVPINYQNKKAALFFIRDITQRREAEKELSGLRNLLSAATSAMTDAIYISDTNGNFLYANEAFARFFRFDDLEKSKRSIHELQSIIKVWLPDGKLAGPDEWAVSRALKGETASNQEYIMQRVDTGEKWIGSLSFSPIRDSKGRVTGSVVAGRDITAQKEAENELMHTKSTLQTALSSMVDVMFISDTRGNIMHMNQAFAHFHRFRSLEECPRHLDDYAQLLEVSFPDGRLAPVEKWAIPLALKGESSQGKEYAFRRKDTGETWIASYSFSPLRNHMGEITGAVVTARDITWQKQQEKLLRLVIDNLPVGVIISDENGKIIMTNPEADKIWAGAPHVAKEQFHEYRGWWASTGQRLEAEDWAMARAITKGETSTKEEINIITFDGLHKTILNSALPIRDATGNITGSLVVIEDITLRKQAEEALKQAEIDRASAQFKQNFLANMSHEIRTPLTGVMGMINILQHTSPTEQQKEYISILKSSGENLREIINQILDLSKIEAGKVSLNYSSFEFETVLNNARLLFKGLQKEKVDFHVETDPGIPEFIGADMRRISQVLNNLVLNAIKFTEEGEIKIQARLQKLLPAEKAFIIKINVVDTGIGISEDKLKQLFNPFFQVGEDDILSSGTGLGLAISKELVGLHGGQIGVYSEKDKCSNFWFTFRAKQVESTKGALSIKSSGQAVAKSLSILLVEDNRVNRKVFQIILGFLGHNVEFAHDGQQALEVFNPGKFDLVLMDINMPVMDGITATRKLREKYPTLPPIVGLSANAAEGDREKYLQQGLDEYLTKPLVEEEFNLMVKKLFGGMN